jgi:hypothetical protein
MAGDYIPIRCGIHREPEILSMAEATGRTVCEVVGLCVAFWDWIQSVSANGRILSANLRTLCAAVGGDEQFWSAMASVKWLDATNGIAMPKFDLWLSNGAKRRLKEAKRKRLSRENLSAKCPRDRGQNADKMRTRGEERRVDDDDPPNPLAKGAEKIDWESIRGRWNSEIAPKLGVSQIEALTDERKRKLASRLRDHADMLDRILAEVPHLSAWAKGENFYKFDWFLSPRNLQKWIEGSYREKDGAAQAKPRRLCRGCGEDLATVSHRDGSDVCQRCEHL